MQNKVYKIFIFFFGLVFSLLAHASTNEQNLLAQADQLFHSKKYTESYKIYYDLYKHDEKFTPQTLLKMAMIKEALGEYTEALFFLNTFYENYPDKNIFNKMKEIAEKQKLEGYHYSDLEFFSNLYRTYHDEIILGVLGLIFLYFLAVVTNKIFIKGISNTSPVFFVFFLIGTFYLINFGENYINPPRAIVLKDHALLMSAPSAGSKPIETISKGQRVVVLDKYDIWLKIKLQNKTGYIRTVNLYHI